jgi:Sensors of blue-light using FAD
MDKNMFILMYYSELLPELKANSAEVLDSIEGQAKQHNPDVKVNGVLFYDRGHFIQLLEGGESEVWELYQHISLDQRHHKVELIFFEPVKKQEFNNWNMDVFDMQDLNSEPLVAEDLKKFRRVYLRNEKPSASEVARWTKRLITQPQARF